MGDSIENGEKGISSIEVLNALEGVSQREWEDANWPIITAIPKGVYHQLDESTLDIDFKQKFFEEVFNQENFLYPDSEKRYEPQMDILFVLHSFNNREGEERIFKAITTSPKSIVQDPSHLIDYRHHGQPCEVRSRQLYPTCDFWDFYDNLPLNMQDNYPIPSKEWRKGFVLKRYFNS